MIIIMYHSAGVSIASSFASINPEVLRDGISTYSSLSLSKVGYALQVRYEKIVKKELEKAEEQEKTPVS